MFCDGSAREINGMLEAEFRSEGVWIETGCAVEHVSRAAGFTVGTARVAFRAPSLVIASGGLSVPKMGATSFGSGIAKQFGLKVVPCRPALVPLTFRQEDHEKFDGLAGVSADARAAAGGGEFREKILFTHRGLSGPAILQASSYWTPGETVEIDLLPGLDFGAVLRECRAAGNRAEARMIAGRFLPKRLADRWFEIHNAAPNETRPAAMLGDREIDAISRRLHQWRLRPAGTEGYEKAEVTAGGVDTDELWSKTMEARNVPGLYFVGEVVDVTGQLGGFNFQWAWASGYAAGQVV